MAVNHDRRLSRVLSSQGDGTGDIDMNLAGVSITGATTASPVVCTAATHGYLSGDWLWIDGATGTTEINGLREVVKVDANEFSLLDEAGDAVNSAGTFGGTVDSHQAFLVKPSATQVFEIARMNGKAADAAVPALDGLLGVTRLTNGIRVAVYNSSGLVQHLTPTPIKGWNDWSLATGGADAPIVDITNTKIESGFRWTFTKYGPPLTLNGADGDFLVVYSLDDLDGLSALQMAVQGEIASDVQTTAISIVDSNPLT
jgi:hypothetical protein